MKYFISFIWNSPLWLALKFSTEVLHDQYAKLWYEDAGNFPKLNFFSLLLKRPYYRQVLFYRLRRIGDFLRPFYPQYGCFSIKSWKLMPEWGGGIYLDHPFGSIINAKKIGCNLKMKHLVTIGNSNKGIPVIGEGVSIGCGAVIAGDILIGDNVTIGANSVVLKNVPSNSTVVGNPARIVRLNGEKVNIKL